MTPFNKNLVHCSLSYQTRWKTFHRNLLTERLVRRTKTDITTQWQSISCGRETNLKGFLFSIFDSKLSFTLISILVSCLFHSVFKTISWMILKLSQTDNGNLLTEFVFVNNKRTCVGGIPCKFISQQRNIKIIIQWVNCNPLSFKWFPSFWILMKILCTHWDSSTLTLLTSFPNFTYRAAN